ncbi:MAG: XRE family transcriptional regulator [Synergistaceae bacterium]|nr:XRE family transcriptional regulator [Synergistaceae bacterium]
MDRRKFIRRKDWDLKWLRQALKLTQAQVAEMLGCSIVSYYNAELGRPWAAHRIKKAWMLLRGIAIRELDLDSLRTLRCKCGLLQAEVARRLKCSRSLYQKIEYGKVQRLEIEEKARALFKEIIDDLESDF